MSDIFYINVSFKLINFSFHIFLIFSLNCLLASHLTLFRLSTFLGFGCCNYCILAWFLGSEKRNHSSSKQFLWCFSSHRPRLSLALVVILSLMFSQALLMSSLSFKFSKADKCVPVTTSWRVLGSRKEERLPIWRVAASILNKQLQTANKSWFSSLGVGRVLTTPHRKNWQSRNIHTHFRSVRLLWYDLNIRELVPNNIAWNLITHFTHN